MEEILFLVFMWVIYGAENWRDIERFGKEKIDFLRQVFPFKNGISSDDTIRWFFQALDPKVFQTCVVSWIKNLKLPTDPHIAIDRKVSRYTFDRNQNPLYVVSAFASEGRPALPQRGIENILILMVECVIICCA